MEKIRAIRYLQILLALQSQQQMEPAAQHQELSILLRLQLLFPIQLLVLAQTLRNVLEHH